MKWTLASVHYWLNLTHSYTGDFSASGIERAYDRVPSRETSNEA